MFQARVTPIDRNTAVYGSRYVTGWPTPAKLYPNECAGKCVPAGRKVGGYARRLPSIWGYPKEKDQIIQKWDPISKRLVNVQCPCITPPS